MARSQIPQSLKALLYTSFGLPVLQAAWPVGLYPPRQNSSNVGRNLRIGPRCPRGALRRILFEPEVGGASTTEEGLLVPEILLAMAFSMQTTSPDLLRPFPSSVQFCLPMNAAIASGPTSIASD